MARFLAFRQRTRLDKLDGFTENYQVRSECLAHKSTSHATDKNHLLAAKEHFMKLIAPTQYNTIIF